MTEAERVRAWRDKKRGGPPRVYIKQRKYRSPRIHQAMMVKERESHKRAIAIRQAWDCPLLRAIMRRIKLEGK